MFWVILAIAGAFLAVVCMQKDSDQRLEEAETPAQAVVAWGDGLFWIIVAFVLLVFFAMTVFPALLPPGSQ